MTIRLRTHFIDQYDLSIQRELARSLVLETSYVGSSLPGELRPKLSTSSATGNSFRLALVRGQRRS
jgi:hypothetical protein